jgi:hypothetical protein
VDYTPGHPWYYKLGGEVLPVEAIEPMRSDNVNFDLYLKRHKTVVAVLALFEQELARETEVYNRLRDMGAAALSRYDVTCEGGAEMALCSALSLVHNHISYAKGYIAYIRGNCQIVEQTELF